MRIICVLNAHGAADVLLDTIDSIHTHLTRDVLVVIDGAKAGCLNGHDVPASTVQGLIHGAPKSPYRNTTLGLMMAHRAYPDADWYCYIEYDCLIGSSRVKADLAGMPDYVWCVGNDLRHNPHVNLEFGSVIVKNKLPVPKYLLGCCVFHSGTFIRTLAENDIFNRILWYTNDFTGGFFPKYNGYDVAEHLFPTLAEHYGGSSFGFARYYEDKMSWEGDAETYPMRWRPDLSEADPYRTACIMHPLKSFDNPIREYHRNLRNARRT